MNYKKWIGLVRDIFTGKATSMDIFAAFGWILLVPFTVLATIVRVLRGGK